MRCFFVALAIAGAAAVGFAQEQSSPEAPQPARSAKIEHLLQAAAHLEAAGLNDDAKKLRSKIEQEKTLVEGDIKALQAEVERLRGLSSHPMQVVLHVLVLEASPEKLKAAGIDSRGSRVFNSNDRRLVTIHSLLKEGPVKVLASPTIVTLSGRACSFHSGGHIPVPSQQNNGASTIDWKRYGTSIEFLPVVLADRSIHMECRLDLSELDADHTVTIAGTTVPGIRSRSMDTSTDIRPRQALLVGGMVQSREVEGVKKEVEMLVLLTPEIVEPLAAKP